MLAALVVNKIRGGIKVCAVKAPGTPFLSLVDPPAVTCLSIMVVTSILSALSPATSYESAFRPFLLYVDVTLLCVVVLNSLFNTVLQGLVITEKRPFKISP